jgi:thioredoxin reductase (NADPH)
LRAATVIVAGGVGSFQPRRLKIDGIARFENSQVFYGTGAADAAPAGERTVVIGDDDAALDCAIRLAASVPGAGVTLMHRRDEFRANPATIARMRQLRDAGCLTFIAAQATGFDEVNGRLTGLRVLGADAVSRTLALDRLLVLTGLSPRLGPIAEWGLALERKQVVVNPATFETSEPGIFAVGDVNTYPGKRKLILCGFHEATLAAFAAAAIVFPDRPVHLEYTTTSPRLHRALGIAPATEP